MSSNRNPYMAAGIGGLGAGIGMLGADWNNPADAGMGYLDQIPSELRKYLEPYINAGNEALPTLKGEYGSLLGDPGARLNKMGQSYQQSPGYQFALQQAMQGANHAAAAGGMAGSPQHQQQSMQLASNLASQDYNNWIRNTLDLYGQGLQGEENLYGIGAGTGMSMGEDLASVLANKAKLAYEGQNAENQREGGIWGTIGSGLGLLGAGLLL